MLLAWRVGARMGALRGLDVDDFDCEAQTLAFRHRPPETPLKNKHHSECVVALAPETTEVVAEYISVNRIDATDENDREPLLTTTQGRIAKNTIRRVTYKLTHPCVPGDCPHDRDRETCEFRDHGHASKCPSALSPYRIRTGSITHMRERGMPPDAVAERVDATPETIRHHYDESDEHERAEQRRKHLERIDFA